MQERKQPLRFRLRSTTSPYTGEALLVQPSTNPSNSNLSVRTRRAGACVYHQACRTAFLRKKLYLRRGRRPRRPFHRIQLNLTRGVEDAAPYDVNRDAVFIVLF